MWATAEGSGFRCAINLHSQRDSGHSELLLLLLLLLLSFPLITNNLQIQGFFFSGPRLTSRPLNSAINHGESIAGTREINRDTKRGRGERDTKETKQDKTRHSQLSILSCSFIWPSADPFAIPPLSSPGRRQFALKRVRSLSTDVPLLLLVAQSSPGQSIP